MDDGPIEPRSLGGARPPCPSFCYSDAASRAAVAVQARRLDGVAPSAVARFLVQGVTAYTDSNSLPVSIRSTEMPPPPSSSKA